MYAALIEARRIELGNVALDRYFRWEYGKAGGSWILAALRRNR